MGLTIYMVVIILLQAVKSEDPCSTQNVIDNWKRSAAYVPNNDDMCDTLLSEGWYKVSSGAGQMMPTTCPRDGNRCGTIFPIWLSNEGVKAGEHIYPQRKNEIVNRVGCAATWRKHDCCFQKTHLKIAKCEKDEYAYYLTPAKSCQSAYCFGNELPCPEGKSSDTGFSPKCGTFPNDTVTPNVVVGLHRRDNLQDGVVQETIKFECQTNLDTKFKADVRWFINGREIKAARRTHVEADKLDDAILLQKHWEGRYKPNMKVKCSLQLRQTGYDAPGPKQFSPEFFAGVIIEQKAEHKVLKENEAEKKIPVRLTIPVGCEYSLSGEMSFIQKQKDLCVINFLGGIPTYQDRPKKQTCANIVDNEGIKFKNQGCGLFFHNSNWTLPRHLVVQGMKDGKVNAEDRIMFLRIYIDMNVTSTNVDLLNLWDGVILPDLKFTVQDEDYKQDGKICWSHNDPHMRTFDDKQYSFYKTEGEYLLYKHSRLPVEIHSFYQKCNLDGLRYGALCNCGAAIRSGNSMFIANFCAVKEKGVVVSENRYVLKMICDGQDMDVDASKTEYTIKVMSGTSIHLTFGKRFEFYGIDKFDLAASPLDFKSTSGLCGLYNGNEADDMSPRGKPGVVETNQERYAESWRITDDSETLFDLTKISKSTQKIQEYCTCKTKEIHFPYGKPDFICNISKSNEACRKKEQPIYTMACKLDNFRTRRDVSRMESYEDIPQDDKLEREKRGADDFDIEEFDDDAPDMFTLDIENGETNSLNVTWQNGWNDQKARKHCIDSFQTSAAYSVCSTHVPVIPSEKYIRECIEDIKLAGNVMWTDVSVNNFASACALEASRQENLSRKSNDADGEDTQSIFDIIKAATCPQNCSGHGVCLDGECSCSDDFFGAACETDKSEAPILSAIAFNGLCDKNKKPCEAYNIPGLNFREDHLVCKFRHFIIRENETFDSGTFEHVPGVYKSQFAMKCPAPASRRKRSLMQEQSAIGYYISVSNDGLNFTRELPIIIFDSKCFECNTKNKTCTKLDSCPKKIKGKYL